jgi:hypothetical protein
MTATGHQLEESIEQLAAMIEGARQMAEAGQMVELDVLAMKIAVLTDALTGKLEGKPDAARPNPLVPKLERLMTSLDHLEIALRKRNVNLALDLQQADRRLRAQVAYRNDRSEH